MTLAIVGYASLDYSTSTADFRGIDATSILRRGIVGVTPGIGGIAHIARAAIATGEPVEAVSWVGPDSLGSTWSEALVSSGCGTAGIATSGSRSPSATLIEVATGGTICLFDPADCHPEHLTDQQRAALARSSCIVLTVSPRPLTVEILDMIADEVTLVWAVKHDDDAYSTHTVRRLLARADVVSFSSGERGYLSLDGRRPETLVRPGTLVVETHGARGVSWSFGSPDGGARLGSVPVDAVSAVDTTGAGDTFIGTLAGLTAQSGPLSDRTDEEIAALVGSASRAAADLLRSRSLSGPSAAAPLTHTPSKENI
ncbi:carbohydrate kinase family protein [Naasia lichenicola]|uniref:carbohydrate kinase family protein n=1 Tax=Naasia lichenicola TaxID=2565933 RepID=UPI00130DBB95|nr:carbohydrate kinase family protein [Naasia lichenicola]